MDIVCLPGTLCAPALFDRLSALLPGIVVIDWTRDGEPTSTVESVAEQVAARLTAPAVLLGHSTGGAIALQVALAHPDRVAGLVLVGTGASTAGHGDVDALITAVRTEWGDGIRRALLARSFATAPDPLTTEVMLAYMCERGPDVAVAVLRSQRTLDLTPRLAELAMPVAVVHGRLDRARPVAHAEALVAGIPGARLHLLDAGHSPIYEAAEEVARIVGELRTGLVTR